MIFLKPVILWGLALLAVPVIIHLFSFRKYRTFYFSSLRFIREIKSEQRRKSQLKDWLLLLTRMLLITFLVIGFARPVISDRGDSIVKEAQPLVIFVIDVSPSMSITTDGQSPLLLAKKQCRNLAAGFPPSIKYMLCTNNSKLADLSLLNRDQLYAHLERLAVSPLSMEMGTTLSLVNKRMQHESLSSADIFIASDFQNGSLSGKPVLPSRCKIHLIRIPGHEINNISLDSCWFSSPVYSAPGDQDLYASVTNHSDKTIEELPVRLVLNDTLTSLTNITLPPKSTGKALIRFKTNGSGWIRGKLEISDYPVTYDNQLFFSFKAHTQWQILQLYDNHANPYITGSLNIDPFFELTSFQTDAFPQSSFNRYDMVILSGLSKIPSQLQQLVSNYLDHHGTIWLVPAKNTDIGQLNLFTDRWKLPPIIYYNTSTTGSKIPPERTNWLSKVILNPESNLQMPRFQHHFLIRTREIPYSDLLVTNLGDPLITRYKAGNGVLIFNYFPLEKEVTDLVEHPVFIPLLYDMVTHIQRNETIYQVLSSMNTLILQDSRKNNGQLLTVTHKETGYSNILNPIPGITPGQIHINWSGVPGPGFYPVSSAEDTLAILAFNTTRKESLIRFEPDESVRKYFGTYLSVDQRPVTKKRRSAIPISSHSGKDLSPLFLFLTLLMIAVEIVLIAIFV